MTVTKKHIEFSKSVYDSYAQVYADMHTPKARNQALSQSRFTVVSKIQNASKPIQFLAKLFLIYPFACLCQYAKDKWEGRQIFIAHKKASVMKQLVKDAARDLISVANEPTLMEQAHNRLRAKIASSMYVAYAQKDNAFKHAWLDSFPETVAATNNEKFKQEVRDLIENPNYTQPTYEEQDRFSQRENDVYSSYYTMVKKVLQEEILPELYDKTVSAFGGDQRKALDFLDMSHQGVFFGLIMPKTMALTNKFIMLKGDLQDNITINLGNKTITTTSSFSYPDQEKVAIFASLEFGKRVHMNFHFKKDESIQAEEEPSNQEEALEAALEDPLLEIVQEDEGLRPSYDQQMREFDPFIDLGERTLADAEQCDLGVELL